ncbi:MAG TPA: L-rhamnose mutarotase [Bryobacteraceae bacterium]|nr:L-rhamnose mutarotase [Bryobacteraceae bacterium]
MQRKIYRTRLRPEYREAYIEAHRNISSDLLRRYRDAGVSVCAVYILGDDMILLVEAEDSAKTAAILAEDPVDQQWQSYLRPMKADGDWQEMDELFFVDLLRGPV